jgi:hypothetical protein
MEEAMNPPKFLCGECGAHLTPDGRPLVLDTKTGAHCPLCGTELASLAPERPREEPKQAS